MIKLVMKIIYKRPIICKIFGIWLWRLDHRTSLVRIFLDQWPTNFCRIGEEVLWFIFFMFHWRIFGNRQQHPWRWIVWWHRFERRNLLLWRWLWCRDFGIVWDREGERVPWLWLWVRLVRAIQWVIHWLSRHPFHFWRWRWQRRFSSFRSIERVGF